ncbi:TolB-like translocation protein [Cohnella cholangitidis]|uniref:WD40 repeat domain-containing protein n=1 Tax=Cohnella cholangitidis TaxID=2598458 RepID=A0A7G5BXD8_9BACL|nr:hypothetical protein [Cohnella cholangitidis]QMV41622.1 hypothetical protein FPL14_10835 [Cohnella cholangitidis]
MVRSGVICAFILGIALLASCTSSNSEQAEPLTSSSEVGNVNDYWEDIAKQGLMMSPFVDPEPPMEYIRIGLKHANPDVRWFCAYKILKHAPQLDRQDRDILNQLTRDDAEAVRQAATFVESVLQETFDGDRFKRSPASHQVAFHLYHESRYNDGELWVALDGKLERLTKLEGSITKLAYSPDGKKISAEYGGRIWSSLAIVDSVSGNRALPDIIGEIIADPANGYDVDPRKVDRFDPYLQFIEWSPDSTRLLVSYSFSEGLDKYDYGWAIYNAEEDKIVKVYPSERAIYDTKPDGFNWDIA